jgi:hypothetical protein
MTAGVIPGISWITITPGPLPLRYVRCVIPPAVWLLGVQESSRPMALKAKPAEHPGDRTTTTMPPATYWPETFSQPTESAGQVMVMRLAGR